jgi:hypothetical protein
MRIATGEIEDAARDDEHKGTSAVARGRRGGLLGGNARARALSAEDRQAIAKKAADTRWSKKRV